MCRKLLCCCLLIFWGVSLVAASHIDKYARVDSAALAIPDDQTHSVVQLSSYINRTFLGEEAKIRAIYIWMTHRLRYNVFTTFVSRNDLVDENREIEGTLKSREGVCRQFAMLFRALAGKVGIRVYVIDGYNKSGTVVLPEPHEWCTARINSQWFLFDPTYGMGYVRNYRFVSAPNTDYFKVEPQDLIKSHMPFDPLWQLLERPYSYVEFEHGAIETGRKVDTFYWKDSLDVYISQNRLQRLEAAARRVLANGKGNRLVDYFLQLTQANIRVGHNGEVVSIYKLTLEMHNEAIDQMNAFIRYRRSGFTPKKEQGEVRRMISDPELLIVQADSLINTIRTIPTQYENAVMNLRKSIMEVATEVYKEKLFVEKYYAATPSQRKKMLRQL